MSSYSSSHSSVGAKVDLKPIEIQVKGKKRFGSDLSLEPLSLEPCTKRQKIENKEERTPDPAFFRATKYTYYKPIPSEEDKKSKWISGFTGSGYCWTERCPTSENFKGIVKESAEEKWQSENAEEFKTYCPPAHDIRSVENHIQVFGQAGQDGVSAFMRSAIYPKFVDKKLNSVDRSEEDHGELWFNTRSSKAGYNIYCYVYEHALGFQIHVENYGYTGCMFFTLNFGTDKDQSNHFVNGKAPSGPADAKNQVWCGKTGSHRSKYQESFAVVTDECKGALNEIHQYGNAIRHKMSKVLSKSDWNTSVSELHAQFSDEDRRMLAIVIDHIENFDIVRHSIFAKLHQQDIIDTGVEVNLGPGRDMFDFHLDHRVYGVRRTTEMMVDRREKSSYCDYFVQRTAELYKMYKILWLSNSSEQIFNLVQTLADEKRQFATTRELDEALKTKVMSQKVDFKAILASVDERDRLEKLLDRYKLVTAAKSDYSTSRDADLFRILAIVPGYHSTIQSKKDFVCFLQDWEDEQKRLDWVEIVDFRELHALREKLGQVAIKNARTRYGLTKTAESLVADFDVSAAAEVKALQAEIDAKQAKYKTVYSEDKQVFEKRQAEYQLAIDKFEKEFNEDNLDNLVF